MSRQRQRARAERERQQLETRAEKERQRAKAGGRRQGTSPARAAGTPSRSAAAAARRRRPRRFGAMPVRLRIGLALGWFAVQLLVAQFVPDRPLRIGIALATLLFLPVVVVLVRDPRRRSR